MNAGEGGSEQQVNATDGNEETVVVAPAKTEDDALDNVKKEDDEQKASDPTLMTETAKEKEALPDSEAMDIDNAGNNDGVFTDMNVD